MNVNNKIATYVGTTHFCGSLQEGERCSWKFRIPEFVEICRKLKICKRTEETCGYTNSYD